MTDGPLQGISYLTNNLVGPGTTNREPSPQYPMGSDEQVAQGVDCMIRGREYPPPRSFFDKYKRILQSKFDDPEKPKSGQSVARNQDFHSWWEWATSGTIRPLMPETYADSYVKKAACPEEFWRMPWKWSQTRRMNPKIPPPVDGKYLDHYHFLAYRHWFQMERAVYIAEIRLVKEAIERCKVKEGMMNGPKNCKHLVNKYFAMTRYEEMHQAMLYMAMTGNKAIRETPYPSDFVEQKRKVYDDWLTRTRMKQPGDAY